MEGDDEAPEDTKYAMMTPLLFLRTLRFSIPHQRIAKSLSCRSGHFARLDSSHRSFQTTTDEFRQKKAESKPKPGSLAFADCEYDAVTDLLASFAKTDQSGLQYLDLEGARELLNSIGERPDEETLRKLYQAADMDGNGVIELHVSMRKHEENIMQALVLCVACRWSHCLSLFRNT
jgi:hypothetical protein